MPKVGTDFALNTGTNIPAIGFGTWKIPKESAKDTVIQAVKAGYRHFDCALEYGNQEQIGDALHELIEKNEVPRGDLFITSKLWNTHHKRHSAYDDIESSLRQLKIHHLDLWLMHWPFAFVAAPCRGNSSIQAAKDQNGKIMLAETTILETWKAMEEMYKNGKARAIGVSNFTLPLLQKLVNSCEIPPAVLQIELHPYLQQTDLIEYCQNNGIHVTAYSPLGSQASGDVDLLQDPAINEIAKKLNKTPGQVVLQWNLQRHISAIPKAEQVSHMLENLQVFDFDLSREDIAKIEGLDQGVRFLCPQKIWGLPLFPEETGECGMEQAVREMYCNIESAR